MFGRQVRPILPEGERLRPLTLGFCSFADLCKHSLWLKNSLFRHSDAR